jgi:hypothetical protein
MMAWIAALGVLAAASNGAAGASLDTYRGSERPLLIFTPSEEDPRLSAQTTALAQAAAGLTERDMVVLIVGPRRIFATFGRPAPEAEAKPLRRRFAVADDVFRVHLVGKDGGVKLTADAPLSAADVFAVIDAMPMRQREMRER